LIIANFIFVSYIFIFCFTFFFFSNFIGLKIILYTILFGCIFSDIGGFIFGKIFKGPKLIKISPKKTYTGAFGSIVFTLSIISIIFYYYFGSVNFSIIVISITTSIFCQIGDLIFSFLKRKAKMKDTGNFLPGHGGVLDRLDGILLGLPIGLFTLVILN
jgi:phosphatidate cytidylyltransferase